MKKQTIVTIGRIALVIVVLAACAGALHYAFPEIVKGTAQVVSAIVGALALLVGAILNHALTQMRDEQRTTEQRSRDENFKKEQQQRDQRLAEQTRKQDNYKSILKDIDAVIRDPRNVDDQFSKIYLESWVVGSPEVLRAARSFLEATEDTRVGELQKLLNAMRFDLGLPATQEIMSSSIFQKPRERGKLNFRSDSTNAG